LRESGSSTPGTSEVEGGDISGDATDKWWCPVPRQPSSCSGKTWRSGGATACPESSVPSGKSLRVANGAGDKAATLDTERVVIAMAGELEHDCGGEIRPPVI